MALFFQHEAEARRALHMVFQARCKRCNRRELIGGDPFSDTVERKSRQPGERASPSWDVENRSQGVDWLAGQTNPLFLLGNEEVHPFRGQICPLPFEQRFPKWTARKKLRALVLRFIPGQISLLASDNLRQLAQFHRKNFCCQRKNEKKSRIGEL
jgi:hypothetical protein